jgi:hypothetical protein
MATFDKSGDEKLASSEGAAGVVLLAAKAKHGQRERATATMAVRPKWSLAYLFACKLVKRSMQAFKVSSPTTESS